MESIEILKISKSLPQEIFHNMAIPICYTVNKEDYYKLPNYLYRNNNNQLSDEKIDDLINLANINKDTFKKYNKTSKKNNMKSNKSKKNKKIKK